MAAEEEAEKRRTEELELAREPRMLPLQTLLERKGYTRRRLKGNGGHS